MDTNNDATSLYTKVGAGVMAAILTWIGWKKIPRARDTDRTAEILRRLDALEAAFEIMQTDVIRGGANDEHFRTELTLIRQAINGIRALLENPPQRELPRD